jgi:hypothetical protein
MTRVCARMVAVGIAAMLIALPATASAAYKDTPGSVIKDCSAGHYPLKGHYTIKVLQEALDRLDASGDQYTNCSDVIKATISKQELAEHHKIGGVAGKHPRSKDTHGGGSGAHASDLAKKRVHALTSGGGSPVVLPSIGKTITPGSVTDRGASFLSSLPTPLLIVLAALLATVLAVSARSINHLVRSRRPH